MYCWRCHLRSFRRQLYQPQLRQQEVCQREQSSWQMNCLKQRWRSLWSWRQCWMNCIYRIPVLRCIRRKIETWQRRFNSIGKLCITSRHCSRSIRCRNQLVVTLRSCKECHEQSCMLTRECQQLRKPSMSRIGLGPWLHSQRQQQPSQLHLVLEH